MSLFPAQLKYGFLRTVNTDQKGRTALHLESAKWLLKRAVRLLCSCPLIREGSLKTSGELGSFNTLSCCGTPTINALCAT